MNVVLIIIIIMVALAIAGFVAANLLEMLRDVEKSIRR
jgi:hypothetical protein